MRICILSAVIVVIMTNDSCADDQTKQNNLITTYDPGAASEAPIVPRLRSYRQIRADDQLDHHGHIRFRDKTSNRALKFEDDPKGHRFTHIDKANSDSLLVDLSFNDEGNSDENDHILRTEEFEAESDSENSKNKIKFEGNNEESESSDDRETDDEDEDPQSDTSPVVFEGNAQFDEDDSEYSDDSKIEEETSNKPIKFENNNGESNSGTKNLDSERSTVTERVAFVDDSNKNQEPVRKRKRKPKRKPRLQTSQENPAPMAPNSPYPGLGYPGYPGVGYPGPGYPGPGDPNAGYPGYPMLGYPTPGYPAYPGYPSSYTGMAYPTPGYPGHPPYPGSPYPVMSPGYGIYPTPAYQGTGDQRPPVNPVTYPSPGLSEQSGHTETRYPSQEYSGSPSSGAIQSGKPEASNPYPGPEHPYYRGSPVPGYPQAYPGDPNSQRPVQSQAQYRPPVHPGAYQPGYQTGHYTPSRRPKSLTQRAVSAVAEALTSIALYDDYQCVPRLLCEVAGGSTASSPTLLKATASLQPLLSVLQTYNGVSSSPLFLFGRAAVTGMTAKGNPSACIRAYPKCPNDPEKLIAYLNNHNGGFFRFFGQPEQPEVAQQPHNLEQFYNYLSGQYGFQQQPLQNYAYPNPYGYGLQSQNPYANTQNYGGNYYREQNSFRDAKSIESETIEARIQNKPGTNILENENDSGSINDQDKGSKWSFPDEESTKKGNERQKIKRQPERPPRVSKTLKFPDDRSDDSRPIYKPRDYARKEKNIFFPGEIHLQLKPNYPTTSPVNPQEYVFDHKHNFYVKRPKSVNNDDVVYVVRGNGDPNHPEVVKVRPGQSI